jgi:hypothetical protein
MKTISIIAAFLIFALQATIASPRVLQQNQVEDTRTIIAQKLGSNFPKHLVNENKTAQVIFTVDTAGTVEVKQVKNVEADLATYVKEKLQGTIISSIKDMAGETFSIVLNLMVL